ncbi:MAG: hypothetical protein CK424_00130 [Legionella sp.]|nr:MAG: hypothetical protein CK424_00130 [Legionella sp.]
MQVLAREFYNRDTTIVAKELLGHHLVHRIHGIEKIGKIVETEAYLGQHDLACHSSKGRTKRTGVHYAKEWATKPLRYYIQGNAFISKQ